MTNIDSDRNCGQITLLSKLGDISFVDAATALRIIDVRQPLGAFIQEDGGRYIGIDNGTGDAWTEEFPSLDKCVEWLSGEGRNEEIKIHG